MSVQNRSKANGAFSSVTTPQCTLKFHIMLKFLQLNKQLSVTFVLIFSNFDLVT